MITNIKEPFKVIQFYNKNSDLSISRIISIISYKYLVSGYFPPSIDKLRIWEIDTGKLLRAYDSKDKYLTYIFDITPDFQYLVIGYNDEFLKKFDLDTGEEVNQFHLKEISKASYFTNSKCGKYAAIIDFENNITLLSTNNFEVINRFSSGEKDFGLKELVFSPDSKYLVEPNKTTNIWDIETGILAHKLPHFSESVSFSPDGKYLATCDNMVLRDYQEDATENIFIWDTESWEKVKTIGDLKKFNDPWFDVDYFNKIQFSPDGKYIVANYFESIKVFKFETGEMLKNLSCRSRTSAISPDSKYISYDDYEGLKLFEFMPE